MIIITGAAGFIGSALVGKLNANGYKNLILVDDFSNPMKDPNLEGKQFAEKIDREDFLQNLSSSGQSKIQTFFHLGARTDTTEKDPEIFNHLNFGYSQKVWEFCARHSIPLIYASSAATYGAGENGFTDDEVLFSKLKPLNPYGSSKLDFDIYAANSKIRPPSWAGLRFFNVYGPNEYHKGRMASVILHTFRQIQETGKMNLFRSHRPDFEDGQQKRDFIYIKDILDVCIFFLNKGKFPAGVYNIGTGQARTFFDLASATFRAMDLKPQISFIDTPADIRENYQYFTEAKIVKLRKAGCDLPFTALEEGVSDYVKNYLIPGKYI